MPVFPVGTPEAFYQLLKAGAPDPATGKPNPSSMPAFFAAHPETAPFLAWVKTAKPSASYATETYNGINAFYLVAADGTRQAVRWEVVPQSQDAAGDTAPAGSDFLEQDLVRRLAAGPLRWQILPSGIQASNDPLLAARSAAYASSYLRRAGEVSPLHSAPQESKP